MRSPADTGCRGPDVHTPLDPKVNAVTKSYALGEGLPQEIAVGEGSAWVLDFPPSPEDFSFGTEERTRLLRLDRAAGAFTTVASGLFEGGGLAVGEGAVWNVNWRPVLLNRVDSTTYRVDTVSVGSRAGTSGGAFPSSVAVGEGDVWATYREPSREVFLSRVDTATEQVVAMIELPPRPGGIAVGGGATWVTARINDSVLRIDPEGNRVTREIPVGRSPESVAFGEGAVWVANTGDGTVSRIDPETNEVVVTIDVGGIPTDIAVGDDAVWVAVKA